MNPRWRVKSISWEGPDRDLARRIRHEVFVGEQRVPEEEEWDAADETAYHVLAYRQDGEPAATGRLLLFPDDPPELARIGRMAVARSFRGEGAGRAVLEALIGEARRRGYRRIRLAAQVAALGFYEKCGFAPFGEEFEEAGITHRWMEREI